MLKNFEPNKVFSITSKAQKYVLFIFIIVISIGLLEALIISPEDYIQSHSVRIMYVHVPSAWISLGTFSVIAILSFSIIIFKIKSFVLIAKSLAPAGLVFNIIALVTGSIWGKPTWGTWWVWDARLTSMLVLFFFFLGHIALSNAFNRSERGSRPAALLAIIGSINLPIVKFSVDWWNTLHQPASILRTGGISIDQTMLIPLVLMTLSFHFYFFSIVILRANLILKERKIEHLQILGGN